MAGTPPDAVAQDPAPAVVLQGASKAFGGFVALQPTDLAIPPGCTFGLLGQNGAGKTTLQRLVATVLAPTAGSVQVGGHDTVTEAPAVRRLLGVLPELWGLYERLTVRENLWYHGQLHGMARQPFEAALAPLAADLEMGPWLDRRVGTLSKGMRQKAAYARALVHAPGVVVLDEPTSGLDVLAERAVRAHLRSRHGVATVVVSTHHLSLAEEVCDRVGLLHQGRLVATATTEELVGRHGGLLQAFLHLVGTAPGAEAGPSPSAGPGAVRVAPGEGG